MNNFDLKKFLAEGGIEARLRENFFEEELQNEGEDKDVEKIAKLFLEEGDEVEEAMYGGEDTMDEVNLDEMARTSNTFSLKSDASVSDVRSFMTKVNNLLKTYKSPGQKKPKSRFTDADMDRLASVLKKENFTSKDILDAIAGWSAPAQANSFIKVLQDKGYIGITSELKKFSKPERDPNAPETRGRKKKVRDEDGDNNKKKDKEPTDDQIRKAAKKAGLDENLVQNDIFLNSFLKKKSLTEDIRTEEEIANMLDSFYGENLNLYPNVETFADEVRTALDSVLMKYSDDVDM
jgi:hypothetical protein